MSNYDVVLDAGHGGFGVTPGKRTPDGEYEWDFNNKVVKAAQAFLEKNGLKVLRVDDPTGKTDVPLSTRTKKANASGAKVFASYHHNANTGKWGTWTGTETFTYLGKWPDAEKLAKLVQDRLVEVYGLKDRGLKKADFHVVRETSMPAILAEGGYMDSTIDIKKLRDDALLKRAGEALALAIMDYLGVKVKEEVKEVQKPASSTKEIYRVRKSKDDAKTQKGAFTNLESAKDLADKNSGYEVYNEGGKCVYTPKAKTTSKPASTGIKSIGKIKIMDVSKAAIIMDKPDRDNAKNIGTIAKGKTIEIAGSVIGKANPKGYWEVIFEGKRAYISAQFGMLVK